MSVRSIARDLEMIERGLSGIRRDLVQFDPLDEDKPLSAKSADLTARRLRDIETLVNEAQLAIAKHKETR